MSFDPAAWSNASAEGPQGGEAPPPGLYEVAVTTAEIFTAKSSGEDYIRMAYKVMVGPLAGHEWSEVRGLSAKQIGVQKGHAAKLGVDVDQIGSLEQLDVALQSTVGAYVSVRVKQNGQYRNTEVQARHAGPVGSDVPSTMATVGGGGAPNAAAAGDDDIPFRAETICPRGGHLGGWNEFQ